MDIVLSHAGKQQGLLTISLIVPQDSAGKFEVSLSRWVPLALHEGIACTGSFNRKIFLVSLNESLSILNLREILSPSNLEELLHNKINGVQELEDSSEPNQMVNSWQEIATSQIKNINLDLAVPKFEGAIDRYLSLELNKLPAIDIQVFKLSEVISSPSQQLNNSSAQVLFVTHSSGAISIWRLSNTKVSLWSTIDAGNCVTQKLKRVPGQNCLRLELLGEFDCDTISFKSFDVSNYLLAHLCNEELPEIENFCWKLLSIPLKTMQNQTAQENVRSVGELKDQVLFDHDEMNGLLVLAYKSLYCIYTSYQGSFVPSYQSILDNRVKYAAFKNMRLHLLDEHHSLLIFGLSWEEPAKKLVKSHTANSDSSSKKALKVTFLFTENIPRTLQAFSIEMERYALGLSVEGQFFVSVTTANYPFSLTKFVVDCLGNHYSLPVVLLNLVNRCAAIPSSPSGGSWTDSSLLKNFMYLAPFANMAHVLYLLVTNRSHKVAQNLFFISSLLQFEQS